MAIWHPSFVSKWHAFEHGDFYGDTTGDTKSISMYFLIILLVPLFVVLLLPLLLPILLVIGFKRYCKSVPISYVWSSITVYIYIDIDHQLSLIYQFTSYSLIQSIIGVFPKRCRNIGVSPPGRSLTELFLDFADGTRLGDVALKAEKQKTAGAGITWRVAKESAQWMAYSWDFMDWPSIDLMRDSKWPVFHGIFHGSSGGFFFTWLMAFNDNYNGISWDICWTWIVFCLNHPQTKPPFF